MAKSKLHTLMVQETYMGRLPDTARRFRALHFHSILGTTVQSMPRQELCVILVHGKGRVHRSAATGKPLAIQPSWATLE